MDTYRSQDYYFVDGMVVSFEDYTLNKFKQCLTCIHHEGFYEHYRCTAPNGGPDCLRQIGKNLHQPK